MENSKASLLVVNDESYKMEIIPLKKETTIGRGEFNRVDVPLVSDIVSDVHGIFYTQGGKWCFRDNNSTNGTFIDGRHVINEPTPQPLEDGTLIRIDAPNPESERSFTIVFCEGDYSNQKWTHYPLKQLIDREVTLGRDPACEICIESISLSKQHGRFFTEGDEIFYEDLKSTNGSFVNNLPVRNKHKLENHDVFLFGNIKMIYSDGLLFYTEPDSGTSLSIRGLTKEVNDSENFRQKKIILNNVNLDIKASELVAVIGTSGAGKTTFLNCVNGYEDASYGTVLINNIDLYKSATRFFMKSKSALTTVSFIRVN